MGGKRKLLDELFRVMPAHRCYVEVFSGGAALFFAKEPSAVEVINDINGDLVNLYRVVKDDDEALIARLQWLFASRQIFYEYRDFAKNATLSNLERAARFFFIMKNAFWPVQRKAVFGLQQRSTQQIQLAGCARFDRTGVAQTGWGLCRKQKF